MQFLKSSIQAVERNVPALGLYLLVQFAVMGINLALLLAFGPPAEDPTTQQLLFGTATNIIFIAALCAGKVLAFWRIGKDIDVPLWKVDGDGDAMRRYYPVFFLLGLASFLIFQACAVMAMSIDSDPLRLFSLMVYILLDALVTPVGACVMFARRPPLHELANILAPLVFHLPMTLLIVLVWFVWSMFTLEQHFYLANDPTSLRLQVIEFALGAVTVFLDCVIFAAVFLACKEHRDEAGDDDFDF